MTAVFWVIIAGIVVLGLIAVLANLIGGGE